MPARPLRILQVLRAPVGGLFRHVADLTRELAARGHSVGIVVDSLANDAQTEALLQSLEPDAALGIYRFPMPRLFGAGDLKTPFAVARLARRLDVDIIHGHGPRAASMRGSPFMAGRAPKHSTPRMAAYFITRPIPAPANCSTASSAC